LSFSPKGLKHCKNDEKLNYNGYDEFIYSAPGLREGVEYLHGKHMRYESSVIIKIGKS
jgi:hypothetical protein